MFFRHNKDNQQTNFEPAPALKEYGLPHLERILSSLQSERLPALLRELKPDPYNVTWNDPNIAVAAAEDADELENTRLANASAIREWYLDRTIDDFGAFSRKHDELKKEQEAIDKEIEEIRAKLNLGNKE